MTNEEQTNRYGTIFCKEEGYPYLGIGPDDDCPICGHKGMYHRHGNGASWCLICTEEAKKRLEKLYQKMREKPYYLA